eukprot:TRINITY_DN8220_c0_g1_i2.p1 TRINITY_DN8220_c0_g1~~TRINITY_DN8220_c0_g1_i2.p1  ORF type:complete len:1331 (+),score=419.30 TRINITY_DN8220_c0_g1_i2:118-3993(+)
MACSAAEAVVCTDEWACYRITPPSAAVVRIGAGSGALHGAAVTGALAAVLYSDPSGVALAALPLNGTAAAGGHKTVRIDGHVPHGPAAAVADPDDRERAVFVFFVKASGRPSTAVRVSLAEPAGVDGALELGVSATVPEQVSAAAASDSARLLFGATPATTDLVVIAMHAVITVVPPLADARGGTEVAAVGTGYGGPGQTSCYFDEGRAEDAAADKLSRANVLCTTQPVDGLPMCGGAGVRVALSLGQYGTTVGSLTRYSPPQLSSSSPARGRADTSTAVRVKGDGYTHSSHATCVFYRRSAVAAPRLHYGRTPPAGQVFQECSGGCSVNRTAAAVHVPAVVLDAHTVECWQPNGTEEYGIDAVDVALDGNIYSGAPAQYHAVGRASGIASPAEHGVTPESAADLEVAVVDMWSQPLRALDPASRNISAELCYSGSCRLISSVRAANGTGSLADLNADAAVLQMVAAGVLSADVVFTEVLAGWLSNTTLIVLSGLPSRLGITRQPSATTPAGQPLAIQPVVTLLDQWSNVAADIAPCSLSAQFVPHTGGVYSQLQRRGSVSFTAVTLSGHFGVQYRLEFAALGTGHCSNITHALSDPVRVEDCEPDSFQPFNGTVCRRCPDVGLECNGSTVVLPKPGFWQPEPGLPIAYRCQSHGACIGGAPGNAQCIDGGEGPMCESCRTGYARARGSRGPCTSCSNSRWKGGLIAALMLAAGCTTVAISVRGVYLNGQIGGRIVVLRILIIFLQVLGKFDEYRVHLPDPLFSQIRMFAIGVSFDVSLLQPFNCFLTSVLPIFEMYMLWPIAATVVAMGGALLLRTYSRAKADRLKVPFTTVLTVAFTTSFVIGFMTILTHLLVIQRCDSFGADVNGETVDGLNSRIADPGSREYDPSVSAYTWEGADHLHLWADARVRCETEKYKSRFRAGIAMTVILTGVFPAAFLLSWHVLVRRRWHRGLLFVTGGFRSSRWFWSVLVMARQVNVSWPAIHITDWESRREQLTFGMWGLAFALVAHYNMTPFRDPAANRLETVSLAFSLFLVMASLLFGLDSVRGTTFEYVLSSALVLGLYAVIAMFVVALLPDRWVEAVRQRLCPKPAVRAAAKPNPSWFGLLRDAAWLDEDDLAATKASVPGCETPELGLSAVGGVSLEELPPSPNGIVSEYEEDGFGNCSFVQPRSPTRLPSTTGAPRSSVRFSDFLNKSPSSPLERAHSSATLCSLVDLPPTSFRNPRQSSSRSLVSARGLAVTTRSAPWSGPPAPARRPASPLPRAHTLTSGEARVQSPRPRKSVRHATPPP